MLESVKNIISLMAEFDKFHFYIVDKGAFDVLYPVYKAKKEHGCDVKCIFGGWCKDNKKEIPFVELSFFKNSYKHKPDKNACLVLGSQTNFKATHNVIQLCRDRGIYSVFVFDNWCNYLAHFYDDKQSRLYIPNKICVVDDALKNSLIAELTPYLDDESFLKNIVVVGHPGVEKSVQDIRSISAKEKVNLKNRIGARGKKVILFLLEPIEKDNGFDSEGKPALGYTEYSILSYFFNKFPLENAKLIIRPHPRQDIKKVRTFLSNKVGNDGCDYELTDELSLEEQIAISDKVVGITTVALIKAAKAGKQIISIQVGRNKKGCKYSNQLLEKNLVI